MMVSDLMHVDQQTNPAEVYACIGGAQALGWSQGSRVVIDLHQPEVTDATELDIELCRADDCSELGSASRMPSRHQIELPALSLGCAVARTGGATTLYLEAEEDGYFYDSQTGAATIDLQTLVPNESQTFTFGDRGQVTVELKP